MGAFTTFSREALERYVRMFGMGDLDDFEPIAAGIENSNYFVTLAGEGGRHTFVLTITEDLEFPEVAFFNDLLTNLDRAGLPVPNPVRTLDGMAGTIFCGKPAWLFPLLPGAHPTSADVERCRQVGETLAGIHEGGRAARYSRENPYPVDWARQTLARFADHLTGADAGRVANAIDAQADFERDMGERLPRGIIHGDLFMDNTLFEAGRLSGIIDFYHACEDALITDIAITLNAWATGPDGALDEARSAALLEGYERRRPLEAAERDCLAQVRAWAAMRFVLTRLLSGEGGAFRKDPEEFLRILRNANG